MSLSLIASTFGVIFLAELPDKTALASLVLATRYRARAVIAGAWLAFVLQTAIAVAAGSLFHLLPARPVHVAAGLGFLLFAVLAFRRDEEQELAAEQAQAGAEPRRRLPGWLTSFLVVFAAEWGDLTQLATAAIVARTGQPLSVAVGAIAGLWTVTVIAAGAGAQVSRVLSPVLLTRASGVLFAAIGVVILVTALA
ncbi:MAG TPA: TMEM165/GDT1 family protein [Dehalococcoidia bacterium]|nr:TMEM165/GDT1 family protein [Dehalococcoidia bacterium]